MNQNPTIKVTNIGKRYFNYEITYVRNNGDVHTYTGVARSGEPIEIKTDESNTSQVA